MQAWMGLDARQSYYIVCLPQRRRSETNKVLRVFRHREQRGHREHRGLTHSKYSFNSVYSVAHFSFITFLVLLSFVYFGAVVAGLCFVAIALPKFSPIA